MGRAACALGLLLVGCHSTETVSLPPIEGDGLAVMLGYDTEGLSFTSVVGERWPTFARTPETELYVANFDCALETLGFESPFRLEDSPQPTLQTRQPRRILSLDPVNETWGEEAEMPAKVDETLRRIAVLDSNRCRLDQLPLERTSSRSRPGNTQDMIIAQFALKLDARTLVAARHYGDLALTERTGSGNYVFEEGEARPWEAFEQLGLLLAGHVRSDGDVWVMGTENLWLGHPDRGFTVVTSTVFDAEPNGARMALGEDDDDVWVITERKLDRHSETEPLLRRRLLQFDGTQWIVHLERTFRRPLDDDIFLARVRRHEWVATGFSDREGVIFRIRDGVAVEERFGFDPINYAQYVQHVEGYGIIVGDRSGGLYVYETDRWKQLKARGWPATFSRIVRTSRGLLILGGRFDPNGSQWISNVGQCAFGFEGTAVGILATILPGPDSVLGLTRPIRGGQIDFVEVKWDNNASPVCPP